MEGHVILGKLDLQGQPPLNETLPKDKSETQARDTFPGERTVRAEVQHQAPCWGARLGGSNGGRWPWQGMGKEKLGGGVESGQAHVCTGRRTLSEGGPLRRA